MWFKNSFLNLSFKSQEVKKQNIKIIPFYVDNSLLD